MLSKIAIFCVLAALLSACTAGSRNHPTPKVPSPGTTTEEGVERTGGGGDDLPVHVTDEDVLGALNRTSRLEVLLRFNYFRFSTQTQEYGRDARLLKIIERIYASDENVQDLLVKVSPEIRFDKACTFAGQDVAASAHVNPNSICISVSKLAKKIPDVHALYPAIHAVILHEYSHLMGLNEKDASYLQAHFRKEWRPIPDGAIEREISNLGSRIRTFKDLVSEVLTWHDRPNFGPGMPTDDKIAYCAAEMRLNQSTSNRDGWSPLYGYSAMLYLPKHLRTLDENFWKKKWPESSIEIPIVAQIGKVEAVRPKKCSEILAYPPRPEITAATVLAKEDYLPYRKELIKLREEILDFESTLRVTESLLAEKWERPGVN